MTTQQSFQSPKTETAPPTAMETCDGCGRPVPEGHLVPDTETADWLCGPCLAEQNTCGCSDDDF